MPNLNNSNVHYVKFMRGSTAAWEALKATPGKVSDDKILEMIKEVFDFRPYQMIESLNLKDIDFYQVSRYGHFGRDDLSLPYEKLDKVEKIKDFFDL